jgi:putative polymerase
MTPARTRPVWLQLPVLAVLGAMTFNVALCFINTNAVGVGNAAIIGCEIAIVATVLAYTYPGLDYARFLVIGTALLYLATLALLRVVLGDGLDVKPIRDLLIPIAFFLLGARSADVRTADWVVRAALVIVIAVGIFEYLAPDVFTRIFNVAGFYMERGTMNAAQVQQSSNLFVSGMRPEGASGGRALLPFLGNHRVSSIFLEPVSAGNFGIIVFIWALVRSFAERKVYWGMMLAAAFPIIFSDSRFGATCCLLALLLAVLPAMIRTAAVAVMPAIGILVLVFLPDQFPVTQAVTNGFIGRIIMSGTILSRFDLMNWFGLRSPDFVAADSGYSYTFGGIGIVGLALFWAILMTTRGAQRSFALMRDLAGFYVAILLCISNSPYTIKTGALLWFLVGTLSARHAVRLVQRQIVVRPEPGGTFAVPARYRT